MTGLMKYRNIRKKKNENPQDSWDTIKNILIFGLSEGREKRQGSGNLFNKI